MPEAWLTEHGLPALFLLSFTASTLVPVGSEWLLVALLAAGEEPLVCLMAATVGNTLGALTTYAIGWYGADWIVHRVLRISEGQQQRAARWYRKFGIWSLLLSWVPVIGDPLCLLAGLSRTPFPWTLLLITVGKTLRYSSIAGLTSLALS